jgi:hypothetical protein
MGQPVDISGTWPSPNRRILSDFDLAYGTAHRSKSRPEKRTLEKIENAKRNEPAVFLRNPRKITRFQPLWDDCEKMNNTPSNQKQKHKNGRQLLNECSNSHKRVVWPNVPKLSHGHRRPGSECNNDIQSSSLNPNLKGQWPLAPARC